MKRTDTLGDRMKSYELVTRTSLPRRSYTVLRVDGRAFHTYTRGMMRPFDEAFASDMDQTAVELCRQIDGAALGYVQSDEVSVVMCDFATPTTQAWFDGEVQKITSIAASIATAAFNRARLLREGSLDALEAPMPVFDARVFTLPDLGEVEAYLLWRQRDAVRNSISMAAQAQFSHKRLQGLSSSQMQELLFQEAQINWSEYPAGFKRGRIAVRRSAPGVVTYTRRDTQEVITEDVVRSTWVSEEAPSFRIPGPEDTAEAAAASMPRALLPVRESLPARASAS